MDSAELARIRDDLEDVALPDVCNLLTVTLTVDGMGGFSEAWGTVSADVACRVDTDARRSVEALSGGALQPYLRTVLTLPHGTTLTAQYRVEHSGVTYAVINVNAGSWLACVRAEMERV